MEESMLSLLMKGEETVTVYGLLTMCHLLSDHGFTTK